MPNQSHVWTIGLHTVAAVFQMPFKAHSQYHIGLMEVCLLSGAGAPAGHPSAGNDFRAELAQAKRREAEVSTRVAALEAKLKSSSSGFGEMQTTIQELTHRVQVSAARSSL